MGAVGGQDSFLSSVPIYISLLFTVKGTSSLPGFLKGTAPQADKSFMGFATWKSVGGNSLVQPASRRKANGTQER